MRRSFEFRPPRVVALACAVALAQFGCADPKSQPNPASQASTAKSVGAQGGEVALAGGTASVRVPAGALAQDTTVTLTAVNAPVAVPGSAAGQVVEFTPHGTQFAVPVSISLPYTGDPTGMTVMRLASAQDTEWRPVGGARFEAGKATFESTTFSYYVVTSSYTCTPSAPTSTPCGTGCAAGSFCTAAGTCSPLSPASLCANPALTVINGELPNLAVVSQQQTTDSSYAQTLATAIAGQCGQTKATVSQAQAGVLDPCNDAPLLGPGNTLLVVGGTFAQRLARFTQRGLAPVVLSYDPGSDSYAFNSRGGTAITSFANSRLSPNHDYFVVALEADPARGAVILQVYGMGWEGTPAAVWYVQNKLLPEIAAGTPSWNSYLLVEWKDNGNGQKDAGDTWTVLAKDVP